MQAAYHPEGLPTLVGVKGAPVILSSPVTHCRAFKMPGNFKDLSSLANEITSHQGVRGLQSRGQAPRLGGPCCGWPGCSGRPGKRHAVCICRLGKLAPMRHASRLRGTGSVGRRETLEPCPT